MIFHEIASALGPRFHAEIVGENRTWISNKDRPEFGIFFHRYYNDTSWSVGGDYPKDKLGNHYSFPYGQSAPKIKLSLEKSVSKIAGDIKRRFLPEYETALAKAIQDRAEWNQHYSNQDKNKQRFLDMVGGTTTEGSNEISLNKIGSTYFHKFRVNNNNVDVDMWNVPFDVMEKIIGILKERG